MTCALTDATFSLPPQYYTEYELWLRVGLALYGTDPGLLYLWERFSQQSLTNYRSGVCEQKWQTFSRRDGGLTAGSIFHWAREASRRAQSSNLSSQTIHTRQPTFRRLPGYLSNRRLSSRGPTLLVRGTAKVAENNATAVLWRYLCLAAGGRLPWEAMPNKAAYMFMSGESGHGHVAGAVRRILSTMPRQTGAGLLHICRPTCHTCATAGRIGRAAEGTRNRTC